MRSIVDPIGRREGEQRGGAVHRGRGGSRGPSPSSRSWSPSRSGSTRSTLRDDLGARRGQRREARDRARRARLDDQFCHRDVDCAPFGGGRELHPLHVAGHAPAQLVHTRARCHVDVGERHAAAGAAHVFLVVGERSAERERPLAIAADRDATSGDGPEHQRGHAVGLAGLPGPLVVVANAHLAERGDGTERARTVAELLRHEDDVVLRVEAPMHQPTQPRPRNAA